MNPFTASEAASPGASSRWAGAWVDGLAFAGGLAVAWLADWQTRDLVWSLWLSSLVVGYAMIIAMVVRGVRRTRAAAGALLPGASLATRLAGVVALWAGGLFVLGFFTVHFGMFHFIHSIFLQAFFPVNAVAPQDPNLQFEVYLDVVQAYWVFLPVAFLAERQAFREAGPVPATTPSVQELLGPAGRARKAGGGEMMAPYRNVIRLHLLIFFFAFAHFMKLEHFLVYAVVYAVYFFPWRVLRKEPAAASA